MSNRPPSDVPLGHYAVMKTTPLPSLPILAPNAEIAHRLRFAIEQHELLGPLKDPSPGSPFAEDGEIEELEQSRLVASANLGAALESVIAAKTLWDDLDSQLHMVSVLPTLLRTSLLCYVRAAWVMMPESPTERVGRTATLHMQDMQETEAMMIDAEKNPEMVQALLGDVTDRLREDREKFDALYKAVKSRRSRAGYKEVPNDTKKIREVSRYLFPGDSESVSRGGLLSAWRVGSGHAHGLSWARRRSHDEVGRNGRIVTAVLKPNTGDLCLMANVVAMLAFRVLPLYEDRRKRPGEGAAFGVSP